MITNYTKIVEIIEDDILDEVFKRYMTGIENKSNIADMSYAINQLPITVVFDNVPTKKANAFTQLIVDRLEDWFYTESINVYYSSRLQSLKVTIFNEKQASLMKKMAKRHLEQALKDN